MTTTKKKIGITEKNFMDRLSTFETTRKKVDRMVHELAVFALNHVHVHGDPLYLNLLWDKMGVSYQGQFRRYAIAVCSLDVNDLSSSWLTIQNKQWVINPEFKGQERKVFYREKGQPEKLLQSAEELIDLPPFTDIDVDTVKNPFADENIISSLKRMSKRAHEEGSKVSPELVTRLDAFIRELPTPSTDNQQGESASASVH